VIPIAPVRRMIRMKEPRVLNVGQPFSSTHIAPGAPTAHDAAIARSEGRRYRTTRLKCLLFYQQLSSKVFSQSYGSLSMS
jgi:hypothetical protein